MTHASAFVPAGIAAALVTVALLCRVFVRLTDHPRLVVRGRLIRRSGGVRLSFVSGRGGWCLETAFGPRGHGGGVAAPLRLPQLRATRGASAAGAREGRGRAVGAPP